MPATPPLVWLRAFEAAARRLSFKHAAAELNVSPSTISHQVRDLESALNVPLFSRTGNRLKLTEEGQRILSPLSQGFDLIRQSVNLPAPSDRLRVGAFPFLGSEVLLPAVPEIKEKLKLSQVGVQTSTDLSRLVQVESERRLDAVIRYGPKPSAETAFPGFVSIPLFPIRLVPILAKTAAPPRSLEDLLQLPQIKLIGPFDAWEQWSRAFEVDLGERHYVIETDNYHAAVLAVERGEGCCLGVFPFLSRWQKQQRIQALDNFSCVIAEHGHLVFAHHNHDSVLIANFADWLKQHLA